jgi:hypothetical protein
LVEGKQFMAISKGEFKKDDFENKEEDFESLFW